MDFLPTLSYPYLSDEAKAGIFWTYNELINIKNVRICFFVYVLGAGSRHFA